MHYITKTDEDGRTVYVFNCHCSLCGDIVQVEQLIPPEPDDCVGVVCDECAAAYQ